ncbi:ShlB/FhaC/HecB family hemolysin secretion/activation protein [Sphingobium sp. AP49]|uniref:ShlB/FhaC/HecB family hemolysin secretion/activation protein n=1 Tax=Sphingobium sp. AP49 TaxID=1144307 RepID=UPI00026EDFBE|nr:ShlB/FhaC/HecB family hemolysin secretion/activation protein [Sphingobium sp. AP49]WHO40349.1 ShlB/FhaC/HecB family hemolysin secretion/activation protein [Sphingobium sp. AP49]
MKCCPVTPTLIFLACASVGALIAMPAAAQDFRRVVPKLPPATPPTPVTVPDEAVPTGLDQSVLLSDLKGVVFVNGTAAVQAGGVAPADVPGGVAARDLPLLANADFAARVQPYLGRPLTRADMEAIAQLARDAYRDAEQPFMEVSVPPQNVQSGVVQFVVTPYHVGTVNVTGNRHFSTRLIQGMGDLKPGQPLSLPRMRKALDDYNQNPFLTINAIASPGDSTGATDINLEAKDRFPLRAYAGYDNQGTPLLGRDEWYVGLNWGNVLGSGMILSYQFTRSFEGHYTSHSASNVIPLGPDDRILLFGAYATQQPDLGEIFDSKGHSGQISGRWAHDLPGSDIIKHNIQIGVDYKRTDNNLDFLGFRVLDTAVEVFQIPITYSGTFIDNGGRTVVEATVVFSPGDVTPHNDDASLNQLVPFSNATYGYWRLSATRTTFLGSDVSWVARAMFQGATGNLPYSEQLSGGGIGSVRGYDPNTAMGSEGLILSSEIRSPAFSLLGDKADDHLQFGIFADYARLWQRKPYPDLPHADEIASVGFNVNYTVGRYLDLQLQVGQQLMNAPFNDDKKMRASVIATVGF